MATTPNYDIDYNDERLTSVTTQQQEALTNNSQTFDNMIGGVDSQYQGIADTIQSNADKMAQVQQENTDFQIQQIEQQKQQAQKDYTKEQSGSYVDWQKQSNQYGANAEQMASQGMQGSGYSESSKVSMFNTYQNRVAIAREGLQKTMMNYDNNIQQAILQNNSALAQIYSEASMKQAELLLEGFQYKNTLVLEKANKEMEMKQFYSNEYQNVLNQMNTENALAESVRQYNENIALEREQMAQAQARWEEEQRVAQERWQKEYELAKTEAERQALIQEREMQIREAEEKRNSEMYSIAKQNAGSGGSGGNGGNGGITSEIDKQGNTKTADTKATTNQFGNSKDTIKKKDYYFSNGYQPRYVNDIKLDDTGIETSDILNESTIKALGITGKQSVWKAGDRYYIWIGKEKAYKDVTSMAKDIGKAGKGISGWWDKLW